MLVSKECFERGCSCYDDRVDKDPVEVVKKEWVGLTEEEIRAVYGEHHDFWGDQKYAFGCYERDIEAKLKEKNT
jgi:hypothetical protein